MTHSPDFDAGQLESWHLGCPTPMEDDTEMPSFDNLGMVPEIVVDLEAEITDTSVDLTS